MISPEIKSYIDSAIQNAQKQARYSTDNAAYHVHNGVDAPRIPYVNIQGTINYFSIAKNTNGTTSINLFSSSGAPFPFLITAVYVIALDTTAGNITLTNNGNTVCTIAKGTTAGVLTGASSLSHTSYIANTPISILSSSAGNVTVIVVFEPYST